MNKLVLLLFMTSAFALPLFAQSAARTPPSVGTVRTGESQYAQGQVVHMAFVIANPTKKSVVYDFATTQQCDFLVCDAGGRTLWQWSQEHAFSQRLTRFSLGPSHRKLFQAVWNGRSALGRPVPAGVYIITARLTSSNRPAITGGVLVNTDQDPNNIGIATQTPVGTGAIRQVNVAPPVTASTTITIVAARMR